MKEVNHSVGVHQRHLLYSHSREFQRRIPSHPLSLRAWNRIRPVQEPPTLLDKEHQNQSLLSSLATFPPWDARRHGVWNAKTCSWHGCARFVLSQPSDFVIHNDTHQSPTPTCSRGTAEERFCEVWEFLVQRNTTWANVPHPATSRP